MKKTLLSISLLATTILLAQDSETPKPSIEKGTWTVNTNINYSNRNNNIESVDGPVLESKSTNYSFTPNVGYLITKNLEIGIGLGIGFSESSNEREESSWNRNTSGNLSVTTYIKVYKPINNKLFLNLKGELILSRQYSEYTYTNDSETTINDTTSNTYFIGLRPGATYFLSEKIALEFSLGNLGYTKSVSESDNDDVTSDSFSIDLFDTSYRFGASYYF